jgi:hypothetical protein
MGRELVKICAVAGTVVVCQMGLLVTMSHFLNL